MAVEGEGGVLVELDKSRMPYLALFGIGASFLLLIAGFILTLSGFAISRGASDLVSHTFTVKTLTAQLTTDIERAEAARRGFIIDRLDAREKTYRESVASVLPALRQIDQLTTDNREQQAAVEELEPLIRRETGEMDATVRLVKEGRSDEAIDLFASTADRRTLSQIRQLTKDMLVREDFLLAQRLDVQNDSFDRIRTLLILVGIALIATAAGTVFLLRRNAFHLAKSRDRLHVLNTDLEGEVERRTADLTRANEEIQRFAYIVSHDLRSPLVNILGFTAELETTNKTLGGLIEQAEQEAPQLLTEDVRHVQQDLPEAIGFIRASTQKMDRLINAILRLSREGRRTLTPELLPMDLVLDDIGASLAQLIEDAGASLIVEKPIPEITSDRVAIEQIFSNIIENAIKYGDPARPTEIRIRGSVKGRRIVYEIQDNGRGIDPKDHQRIFDLFRRSGAQDKAGEGIGLAQVRALVNRLGGIMDVESELGEGSLFRLSLPATYVDRGTQQ